MIGIKYGINTVKKEFLEDISALGGLAFYMIATVFSYFTGETALAAKLIVSIAVIFAIIYSIKLFYVKPRPGIKIKKSFSFLEKLNKSSFPSVHAARISLLSVALYSLDNDLIYLSALLALVVGYSRIYLKKHYASDVLAGLVVGVFTGYFIFL